MLAIVTPTHKTHLDEIEMRRIRVTLRANPNFQHFFVLPNSTSTIAFQREFPNSRFMHFEDSYFSSVSTYNFLMLSESFYGRFIDSGFEWILLAQADAFVIRDITPLTSFGFHNIGASWNPPFLVYNAYFRYFINQNKVLGLLPRIMLTAGNGGLSLRHLDSHIRVCKWFALRKVQRRFLKSNFLIMNEDLIIALACKVLGIPIADAETADSIFIERKPIDQVSLEHIFGFHALNKHQTDSEISLLEYSERLNYD